MNIFLLISAFLHRLFHVFVKLKSAHNSDCECLKFSAVFLRNFIWYVVMRIAITPQVLEWAIQRSRRQEKLEHKFKKIGEWLSGTAQPTFLQLQEFAKAATVPFGYLLLTNPPEERLPITNFRTLTSGTVQDFSPELLDTVYKMQQRQAWMRDYLTEQGHSPLPFVDSASIADNPIGIAAQIRNVLGITDDWAKSHPSWSDALRGLERKIDEAGIMVMVNGVVGNNTHRKLDPQEFRGFVLVDQYAPLVFINGADGKAAQMFTLAHELAHIWLGISAAFDLHGLQPAVDSAEMVCNQIAAEFLVPATLLINLWPVIGGNAARFQNIARHFKVSEIVAARRCLDLGLIEREAFFNFYRDWQSREIELAAKKQSDAGGGDFYPVQNLRIGNRFGQMLIQSVCEGKTAYTEAYHLTGLKRDTFQTYADEIFGRKV